jgi:hypothetical protein
MKNLLKRLFPFHHLIDEISRLDALEQIGLQQLDSVPKDVRAPVMNQQAVDTLIREIKGSLILPPSMRLKIERLGFTGTTIDVWDSPTTRAGISALILNIGAEKQALEQERNFRIAEASAYWAAIAAGMALASVVLAFIALLAQLAQSA